MPLGGYRGFNTQTCMSHLVNENRANLWKIFFTYTYIGRGHLMYLNTWKSSGGCGCCLAWFRQQSCQVIRIERMTLEV